MSIPDRDHPCWPILRTLGGILSVTLVLALNYSSSFDGQKDLRAVCIVGASQACLELAKKLMAPAKKKKPRIAEDDEEEAADDE